jgi:hypothetical protein
MQTSLRGIAKKAQEQPKHRFGNLYELLDEAYLKECWRDIRKDAAYGVDEVSAEDYERDLEGNVHDLVERLKRKQYRAKLVKRKYIPKGDGKERPLGIPMLRSHCTSYNRLWDFALGRSASPAYPVYHQSVILTNDVTSVVASAYAVRR